MEGQGATGAHVRPLAITYAERRSLDERRGRYDEARGLWVVEDALGESPLVRSRTVALEETVTRQRADPSDQSRPRRDTAGRVPPVTRYRAVLEETKTSNRADPTDQPRPRRSELRRRVPEETVTFVDDEGTDEARPRRVGRR